MTEPRVETPRFVYVAASTVAIGGLLFGYDLVVISGAILFIKQQFALSSMAFAYFLVPETKARSLEEIQAYWHR